MGYNYMAIKVYSFTQGLQKSVVQASIFGLGAIATIAALAYPEVNNLPLANIIDATLVKVGLYLKEIVGTMTVGGVLALAVNWLKFRSQ
jgi:hypothetical protein